MKKAEVKIGATYAVKVSERLVPVTITGVSVYGGWYGRNERTGREVRIRGAQRLRFRVVREDGKWKEWYSDEESLTN